MLGHIIQNKLFFTDINNLELSERGEVKIEKNVIQWLLTNIHVSITCLGWWMYDERTTADIEEIYNLGETNFEIMICGVLYVIDFKGNVQYRKKDPRKKRKIKRDRKSIPNKGVAGIY